MARRRYLVAYDVSDDKRRTKVMRALEDHGERLQYSVFRCDLNARELQHLRAGVHGLLNHATDQVLVVDLGLAERDDTEVIDAIGRRYEAVSRARIV